jgi:prepilin-type processing-associated H-X9-DG protein
VCESAGRGVLFCCLPSKSPTIAHLSVALVTGPSNAIERWVKLVAAKANARNDWHYIGGRANVLFLGGATARARIEQAIEQLPHDGVVLL